MLALTSCQNVSDVIKDLNTKIDNFGTSKRENAVMISQGKDGTYSFACR